MRNQEKREREVLLLPKEEEKTRREVVAAAAEAEAEREEEVEKEEGAEAVVTAEAAVVAGHPPGVLLAHLLVAETFATMEVVLVPTEEEVDAGEVEVEDIVEAGSAEEEGMVEEVTDLPGDIDLAVLEVVEVGEDDILPVVARLLIRLRALDLLTLRALGHPILLVLILRHRGADLVPLPLEEDHLPIVPDPRPEIERETDHLLAQLLLPPNESESR